MKPLDAFGKLTNMAFLSIDDINEFRHFTSDSSRATIIFAVEDYQQQLCGLPKLLS